MHLTLAVPPCLTLTPPQGDGKTTVVLLVLMVFRGITPTRSVLVPPAPPLLDQLSSPIPTVPVAAHGAVTQVPMPAT